MPRSEHPKVFEAVREGIARSKGLIEKLTNYHGGPVETEYILTTDIAHALVDRFDGVSVECKYRNLVNLHTGILPLAKFKSHRADLAVANGIDPPTAVIEIKIRVRRFNDIYHDVCRLSRLLRAINARYREYTLGLVIFQISVRGRLNWYKPERILTAVREVEGRIEEDVRKYSAQQPDLEIEWMPLQGPDEGVIGRELEGGPDDPEASWGRTGHGTRYHLLKVCSK